MSPRSACRKTARTIYRSRMRMTRTVSVAWSRQRSPSPGRYLVFSEGLPASRRLSILFARGMRAFQVSPALNDLPVGDPPNHDSGEFQTLFGSRIRARPMIAHHHFVVFSDHVFDNHAKIGNLLERGAHVLN